MGPALPLYLLICGEPGAGKTFVLRSFCSGLNPSLFKVTYFPLSTGTVMDSYRGLAFGLDEEPCFRKADLFKQIQTRVLSLFKEKRVTTVFVLDEMHMAPHKMLMDLGLFFNFFMDSLNPFVLILAGLPSLQHRLKITQVQPLNQRIVMRYAMGPLEKEKVKEYIDHHKYCAILKSLCFSKD